MSYMLMYHVIIKKVSQILNMEQIHVMFLFVKVFIPPYCQCVFWYGEVYVRRCRYNIITYTVETTV